MTVLNGYRVPGEFTTNKAGLSRWAYCEKEGREFFIKEFLTPVYPEYTEELSPRIVERKQKICDRFFSERSRFYHALGNCRTGNNMVVLSFFREGSHYYIVTEKVDALDAGPAFVAMLGDEQKLTLIRALLYSVAALHRQKIVHADLKPDNVLLKPTTDGFYTAKIIDFDAGFFSGQEPEEVQGDFVYTAPETFLKMQGEASGLTGKIDVFALGLLIHQYWTGKLPVFPSDYQYAFEAVLNGEELRMDPGLPERLRAVLAGMLERDPEQRISAEEALMRLGNRLKINLGDRRQEQSGRQERSVWQE